MCSRFVKPSFDFVVACVTKGANLGADAAGVVTSHVCTASISVNTGLASVAPVLGSVINCGGWATANALAAAVAKVSYPQVFIRVFRQVAYVGINHTKS